MTGGRVVVLGPTGRNFAAGMSGGIAYVLDEDAAFAERCNPAQVDLEPLVADADERELRALVEKHLQYTGSAVAQRLLDDWQSAIGRFVKVMPRDYKRVLEERGAARQAEGAADAVLGQAASGG